MLNLIRRSAVLSVFMLLAACGGGNSLGSGSDGSTLGGNTTGGNTTGGSTPSAASIKVIASSTQLPSAASTSQNGIQISAIVKDANNALLSGVPVQFSVDAGALEVTSATTDATGLATAVLSTGGDAKNQTITVSATTGSVSGSLKVLEVGTALAITGASTVGSGSNETYTVTLSDSSSNPITGQAVTLTSKLGNAISSGGQQVTDSSGRAVFTYTGTTGGADTLSAASTSLNAAASSAITVSSNRLAFTSPSAGTQINFGATQGLTVNYAQNGAAVSGATVNFSATRGTLSASSAVTDGSGNAFVTIHSSGAGGAGASQVTAQISGGPSASLPLVFNATSPTQIAIQASPTTIAPSTSSTVTATVRDANDNLVANQVVNFTLSDTTGGSLQSASGTTNQAGTVTTTYTASTATSSTDGVVLNATVSSNNLTTTTPAKITVAGKAMFITLGTGNTVAALDATRYQMPYSVLVSDSAGNPVPNATVSLALIPVAYQKGTQVWSDAAKMWVQTGLVPSSDPDYNNNFSKTPAFGCRSEDVNNDGVLNVTPTSTEDYNGNGRLDPGSVATVPGSATLDSTGSAQFMLTYPKDHALWVMEQLVATTTVGGTESRAQATFILPGVAADYGSQSTPPPGQVSPYGTVQDCSKPN